MTGLRLDKWLWFARFARTRSLAAKLCLEGCVAVSGTVMLKPGHPVRLGDALTVRQGDRVRRIRVTALATHRGSAGTARQLYLEAEPPLSIRAIERAAWAPLIPESSTEIE
jgi:ribosome-associated heat shock protein Hsp15